MTNIFTITSSQLNTTDSLIYQLIFQIYCFNSNFQILSQFDISTIGKNYANYESDFCLITSLLTFSCSKSTIETLKKGVKYVQS